MGRVVCHPARVSRVLPPRDPCRVTGEPFGFPRASFALCPWLFNRTDQLACDQNKSIFVKMENGVLFVKISVLQA